MPWLRWSITFQQTHSDKLHCNIMRAEAQIKQQSLKKHRKARQAFSPLAVVLIGFSKQCRQVCLDRLLEWARLASPAWEQSNKAPNEGSDQRSFQPRWRDSAKGQVGVRENFGSFTPLRSALAAPYDPSFLSPRTEQPGMSLWPRLPGAAGVFSPGCCTSPRPSRRWTPAPRCARLTRRWRWCLWAGWQEAAWTPHSPSPGKGRGQRKGVRTKHQSHSPLQHFMDWASKKAKSPAPTHVKGLLHRAERSPQQHKETLPDGLASDREFYTLQHF